MGGDYFTYWFEQFAIICRIIRQSDGKRLPRLDYLIRAMKALKSIASADK